MARIIQGSGFIAMLKKVLVALSVTTALVLPCLSQAASLSDSVSQAVSSHPMVEAGKAAQSAAWQGVRERRADFFPVISANARAGRINQDDDTTRANTGGDAWSWVGEGGVTLTQPIYTGFSAVNRSAAAKDRYDAAINDLTGTAEDITLRAARAHLNLMRTRELLDIASKYLSSIQERRDSIKLMVSEGAADEAEELQAEEVLMAARTTRLGYEEAFRQAEADYIQVTGAAPEDTLEFGAPSWDAAIPATVDEAIVSAAKTSPRLKSADNIVRAMGHDANAEKGSIMPRLDAEVSYLEKDQDDDLGGELASGVAQLKMSWNFSTGGGQFARVNKSLDMQREARAKRTDTLRTIERDVRQKFTSMNIVDEQFGLFTDRESAAEKILNNYLSQFEGGKQTNLQIINAHARLFDARTARTDAYYRRLLSRFELLSAMGTLHHAITGKIAEAK